MRRFVVAVTAWAMGLAWVLGGLTPVSASAQIPAVAAAGTVAVSTQGGFTSVAPFRLLDTRIAVPPAKVGVAVPAHGTVRLLVGGRGGVPGPGLTSAVVLNVTATAPTAGGFVTVYQDGDGKTLPTASNLNFVKGQIVPNLVVAPVGSNGKVALYNGSTGTVHLIVDVSGYYSNTDAVVIPPGSVTNVGAAAGTTTIALSWSNPPQASLTAVMIRRAQ